MGRLQAERVGRELGTYGLDEYTELKQINIDLTDKPMGVFQRGKAGAALEDVPPGEPGGDVASLRDRRSLPRERQAEVWVRYCQNRT